MSCLLRWRCVIPVSGYRKRKKDRLVKTYVCTEGETPALYTKNHLDICNRMDRRPAFESGGAGLVSTIDDYSLCPDASDGGAIRENRFLDPLW